jgi:hypothetical protein
MIRVMLSLAVCVLPVLAGAQQPSAPPSPAPASVPGFAVSLKEAGGEAVSPERDSAATPKPFRLDINLVVSAPAPPPEPTEALRGQLQLLASLRRGWYTGPAIQGPIFQYWNAADYTVGAGNTYYGVPYYMRSYADYYLGPGASNPGELTFGQVLAGLVLQGLMAGSHHY